MRIDTEISFVDRSRFHYPWMQTAAPHMHRDFTPHDLSRILSRNKYEGAIAVSMLDTEAETDWLLELTEDHPWILGVAGPAPLPRWLAHPKFAAVHVNVSAAARQAVSTAAAAGKAIDLRTNEHEIAAALQLTEEAPTSARICIVSNIKSGWDPAPWEHLARSPRITFKIRGLINDAAASGWRADTYRPFIQKILEWCGPHRLMYGSDWPRCMYTGTWKESLAVFTQALGAQTIDTRSLILGDNAAAHYALSLNHDRVSSHE
jgi:L-fuconolactonase